MNITVCSKNKLISLMINLIIKFKINSSSVQHIIGEKFILILQLKKKNNSMMKIIYHLNYLSINHDHKKITTNLIVRNRKFLIMHAILHYT